MRFFIISLSLSFHLFAVNATNEHIKSLELADLPRYLEETEKDEPPGCPSLEGLEKVDEILFAFEGTGGYSPIKARMDKFFKIKTIDKRDLVYSRARIKKLIEKERTNNKSENITSLLRPYYSEQREVLYFSHTHRKEAQRCLDTLLRKAKKEDRMMPSVKILGYSWGGNTALRIAKKLEATNNSIKALFTIDPVRKGLGVVKNLFSSADVNAFFKSSENVEYHINLYQKLDKNCLLVGIKGNNVEGAENTQVSNIVVDKDYSFELTQEELNSWAHSILPFTIEAKSLMKDFIDY